MPLSVFNKELLTYLLKLSYVSLKVVYFVETCVLYVN